MCVFCVCACVYGLEVKVDRCKGPTRTCQQCPEPTASLASFNLEDHRQWTDKTSVCVHVSNSQAIFLFSEVMIMKSYDYICYFLSPPVAINTLL